MTFQSLDALRVGTVPPTPELRHPTATVDGAKATGRPSAEAGKPRPQRTNRSWSSLDDRTAGELVRRRLVDLPMPGAPALTLGRHVIRAVDLGGGRHCHEIRYVR